MSNSETDREEKRFAEMLSAIEYKAPSPDKAFLKRLKDHTTQVFLAAERPQAAHERKTLMTTFKRFIPTAAAACIVGGIALVAFLMLGDGGATVAFADARDQILNARTMTWRMSVAMSWGDEEMTMNSECSYMEPGLMRQDASMLAEGKEMRTVNILDFTSVDGRALTLIPAQKQAMIMNLTEMPEEMRRQSRNPVDEMKRLIPGSDQPLGEKMLDGRHVKGFRVTQHGGEMDIWVDSETGQPVLMEAQMPGVASYTMTDFAFDVELDEGLFDLTPPEGYKVKTMDMSMGGELTEEDLIEGLRFFASLSDDIFPAQPTITPEIVKGLQKQGKTSAGQKLTEEETIKSAQKPVMRLTRLMLFIQVRGGDTWAYAGGGVKLGESDAPICWYKPEGSETYRVIYGDLRVEDVAEEDLPVVSEPDQ